MKTLYIDVYFCVNFLVDVLSVFIALRIIHARIRIKRLILSGVLGGAFAIIELFIQSAAIHILIAAIFILLLSIIASNGMSFTRRIKFIISFYLSAFIISGIVNFVYSLLNRFLSDVFEDLSETTNTRAILFSLIIMLIIGVLRLIIMMFSDSMDEKSVSLEIQLKDKIIQTDALVDSGNLVKDPMNMNPVIFLKEKYARRIIPDSVIDLTDIDSLGHDYRKRIRLVPVTRNGHTHVMTGIRVDRIFFVYEKYKEEIEATIVIDKEEGTYGGYYALAPYVSVFKHEKTN